MILWDVDLKKQKKLAVCGLISIGLIATVATVVRVIFLKNLDDKNYARKIGLVLVLQILLIFG